VVFILFFCTEKTIFMNFIMGVIMRNILSVILLVAACIGCTNNQELAVNLRCEYAVNPQGIDVLSPRFSWEISSEERNVSQVSYQILVASSPERLGRNEGDLWDSGVVNTDETLGVVYKGKALQSRDKCFWKVKATTNTGKTGWSKPAEWTMGLLSSQDWQAKWAGLEEAFEGDTITGEHTRLAARYLRKEFPADKKIQQATLYISGLGLYEAYINGKRIGTQVLAPTVTDYTKSVKYNTFDVTKELSPGKNAIGVILGNGRYFSMTQGMRTFGKPRMLLQLEILYTDGTGQKIVSDDSWKVTAFGPIRTNNEFDGETYDARMEMPRWNQAGFDDKEWMTAELVDAPKGKLEAQMNPNIQVMEAVRPVSINELSPGIFIMDMGQNMVGWLRMKVKGEKGQEVKLRFAETLKEDGSLAMDNLRKAQVADYYVLKGAETEAWEPSFVFHGFRYVEITGFPGTPVLADFEGKVVYDEMATTGSFETSDPTINQIFKNAYWGMRGNYRGMPTDCPQRDERLGWLGDRSTNCFGESFIFDNNLLYDKWINDIYEAQREDGSVPDVAPNYWMIYSDNMTWPSTFAFATKMLYQQFGNKAPMVKHYDAIKKWMAYMRDTYMVDHIMPRDTYGDWCMPPESPELIHSKDPSRITEKEVLGTTYYYKCLSMLQEFALLLDKPQDAKAFAEEAEKVKDAFNEKFFNKEAMQYSNNTVTANLLPLYFGMVPEEYREGVFGNIVDKTMGDFRGHISTGLVGAQYMMRTLTDYGRGDLALRIATNRDYPSWGYMIEKGATTIWELWNGNTADPAMNSGNHVMLLGDLVIWFYEYLAGIQNMPGDVAFKQIRMKPYPLEGLSYAKATYRSVRGEIKTSWKKEGGLFYWDIRIPANTSAVVYIPSTPQSVISEGGKDLAATEGITALGYEDGYTAVEVGSGSYRFTCR